MSRRKGTGKEEEQGSSTRSIKTGQEVLKRYVYVGYHQNGQEYRSGRTCFEVRHTIETGETVPGVVEVGPEGRFRRFELERFNPGENEGGFSEESERSRLHRNTYIGIRGSIFEVGLVGVTR